MKTRAGIVNGTFDSSLAGWTNLSVGGGSVAVEAGQCVLQNNQQVTGQPWIEQAIVLDAVPYTLTLDAVVVPLKTSIDVTVRVGTGTGLGDVLDVPVQLGIASVVKFTPAVAGTYFIQFRTATNGLDTAIGLDNISLVANRWTGLDVLEGRKVKVQVDGFIADDTVVTGGVIEASVAGVALEVGLMMALTVTTLPPVFDMQDGSTAGQRARMVKADVYVENSQPFVCKVGDRRFMPLFYKFGSGVLDAPPPVVTDWVSVGLGGVSKRQQLTLTQDDPVPLNILGINLAVGV
jgi:hypothetical protein